MEHIKDIYHETKNHFDTLQVHAGQETTLGTNARAVPISPLHHLHSIVQSMPQIFFH